MPGTEDVFRVFEIECDSGREPVFHGGELITGNLKIELKEPLTIREIKLQFKGRAACTTASASKGAEIEKVYFDKDFTLLERPPGRPQPGHFPWIANFLYNLPFECPLPIGCPTSYEAPNGFIRYFIRATVVEDARVDSKEYIAKKVLTIIAPTETIDEPVVHPIAASETVAFGGCCCRGKLTAELQLPKSFYAPGEMVIGSIKIDNKHPRHIVDQIEIRLVDRVSCVGSKSRDLAPDRTLVIRRLEKADVVKSKSSLKKDEVYFLKIPAVAPSLGSVKSSAIESLPINSDLSSSNTEPLKFPESPSTATLKLRKQPFLRIDYIIQLSLGEKLLLELPITIKALPIKGDSIDYQPFVIGPQIVNESDESGKFTFENNFVFLPYYPVLKTITTTEELANNGIDNVKSE